MLVNIFYIFFIIININIGMENIIILIYFIIKVFGEHCTCVLQSFLVVCISHMKKHACICGGPIK